MSFENAYEAKYPPGTRVRVVARDRLEAFLRDWQLHHPLVDTQLADAGRTTTVESVAYYHGGAPLYALTGIAGTWHESCLELAPSS